jgi:tetratricopeptide (TPR) repeat protein
MTMKTFVLTMFLAIAAAAQQPADVTQQIDAATRLVDSGKVDEAIAALKAIVATHPGNELAQYELAVAYSAKGDAENCRKILEPLSAGGGDTVNVLGMLGNCLDDLGQRDKAIAAYRRGLALAPTDSQLTYNLAVTLAQMQKLDEARELLKTDTRANPWHASGHLALGKIFEAQGFRVPAVLSYFHFLALEASPRANDAAAHLQALLNLGVEKTKKGANIAIDPEAKKDEGDYAPMQLALALAAAGTMLEEKKTLSDFERAREQVAMTIAMFVEQTDDHHDYTAAVQGPFFAAMTKAKLTDTFAALAVAPLRLHGMEEWLKAHAADIARYDKWIAPQQRRPGVTSGASASPSARPPK